MPYVSVLRHRIAFVELTEGELSFDARANCEAALFAGLESSGVAAELITINTTGCFFTINEWYAVRVRAAAAPLNAALRLRPACARITLARGETDWPLPSLAALLSAIGTQGLEVVHICADARAVDLIVNDADAATVARILSSFCRREVPLCTA